MRDGSPTGYTFFPATLAEDFSFSIPNVPAGSYFLSLARDCKQPDPRSGTDIAVKCRELIELTASTPDLSMVDSCRPDTAIPTRATDVDFRVEGLHAWSGSDYVALASSQACLIGQRAWDLPVQPPPGSTSFRHSTPWTDGLPDAAKGDVVFLYQKSQSMLGSGSVQARAAVRVARVTDFSLTDGASATLAATATAPQTGALRVDHRGARFAMLAGQVHPSAVPSSLLSWYSGVIAIPQKSPRLLYGASLAIASMTGRAATTDVDYGTVTYAQLTDPNWREIRKFGYLYDVSIPDPATEPPIARTLEITYQAFLSAQLPIVPLLSPPRMPSINGASAFVTRTGVGTQPVLSWSPPAIGTPTSYVVTIEEVPPAPGENAFLSATIRSTTSFRVPPDFLRTGSRYIATIAAVLAGGDTGDRLQPEADYSIAPCITGVFAP